MNRAKDLVLLLRKQRLMVSLTESRKAVEAVLAREPDVKEEEIMSKVVQELRKSGVGKIDCRTEVEGVVGSYMCPTGGSLICLTCNTDFVARCDEMLSFAGDLSKLIFEKKPKSLSEAAKLEYGCEGDEHRSVEGHLGYLTLQYGEKVKLADFKVLTCEKDELIGRYVHRVVKDEGEVLVGSEGCLVCLSGTGDEELARNVALHVVGNGTPPVCISPEEMPKELIAHTREWILEQSKGCPQDKLEMIVKNKLETRVKELSLSTQKYIRDEKKSVQDYLGKGIIIKSFAHVKLA